MSPAEDFFRPGFLLAEGGLHARVRPIASTVPKPSSCTPARCARSSARPRRRCSSPRATSTTAPRSAEQRFKNEEPGYQYSRFSNPTVTMFEQRMAALEGAEAARATATGMAAVTTALMGQVRAGDHVVASKALFGSCRYVVEEHLPRYGVASTLVDGTDLDAVAQGGAAQHQDLLPGEPDQSRRSRCSTSRRSPRSRTRRARRWWSTTCSRRRCSSSPLELGADCVVYSATKHIDGQGRCLGGVILGVGEIHPGQRPHS